MTLFEVGDLVQRLHTGEVGVVIEVIDIFDPVCFPYPLDYPYGGMGRVGDTMKPRTIPGYKIDTGEGIETWEHRLVRLISAKPLDDF